MMASRIDRAELSRAVEELKAMPFPGHPDDPDLAEWVLELTELDGHLVGLATTTLASSRAEPVHSTGAAQHEARLRQLGAVGDDEPVYDACRDYIDKLVEIEDLLAGRNDRHVEA